MVKKIFLVVFVLALPVLLTARGNMEGEKGQALLMEETFSDLLESVNNGDITLEEARSELEQMQNRYELSEEEHKGLEKILEAVGQGEMTPQEGCDAVPEQIRTREQTQTQDNIQDQTQDKTQNKQSSGGTSSGKGK